MRRAEAAAPGASAIVGLEASHVADGRRGKRVVDAVPAQRRGLHLGLAGGRPEDEAHAVGAQRARLVALTAASGAKP